ncbi:MAG: hypothetical protein H6744_03000 [Deltaproteobacteria bacterium]|nr:hypothetical protein [Deltaproteobacteria bacterium]
MACRPRAALGAALASVLLAASAHAAPPFVDSDDVLFRLGGYARNLSGLQLLPVSDADAAALGLPTESALSATVLRLEWRLDLGRRVTIDLHQRLFLQVTSEPGTNTALGVGTTLAPDRSLDLQTTIAESDTLRLDHDIDRLSVRVYLPSADLAIGRQAITWGTSLLFTTSDVWAAFSPYDLDTSQKRGIDAVRLITQLGERVELDLVLADRGSLADLSGGARATFYLGSADLYLAAAKVWDELSLMAGVAAAVGSFKLRAEANLPWSLDADALQTPRATLGADWFGPDIVLTLEAHLGGTGTAHKDRYLQHALQNEPLNRGEVYLLGRWYAGAAASWKPMPLLTLSLSALANLQDPSLLLAPRVAWEVSADVSLALGAFSGLGAHPEALPTPSLGSEFGSFGHLIYLELAAFF